MDRDAPSYSDEESWRRRLTALAAIPELVREVGSATRAARLCGARVRDFLRWKGEATRYLVLGLEWGRAASERVRAATGPRLRLPVPTVPRDATARARLLAYADGRAGLSALVGGALAAAVTS